ncbi:MAG: lysostaphin resistance A-like protein [Opitutales bacterium]
MNLEQKIALTVLLTGSAIAWLGSKSMRQRSAPPPPLKVSWLDYLIFLWVFLMLFVGVQTLMQFMLAGEGSGEAATFSSEEWTLVLSSLSLQIPMLGVMLVAYSAHKLPFFHADVNSTATVILREALFGVRAFIMCLPIIWVIASVWNVILEATYKLYTNEELESQAIVTTVSGSQDLVPIVILTLLGIIMAPIAEELFFRGSIYRFLRDTSGKAKGAAISALIFAIMHANMKAMIPLFVVGICLAWVYERRGNIWAPIAFHMAFNTQSFIFIYLQRI